MEDDRKGKPVAVIGGMYAKAKQRVLNKMGKRTTLTRNPRVDFISKRVEEIKSKKARVSALATSAKTQLKHTHKTMIELDQAMLDAFKDELGERKWDEAKGTYTRDLHNEEKRLVSDMERVLNRCRETMEKVVGAYVEHLDDIVQKPLTYNTPDEDSRLATVMTTKEEYKTIRTLYSDAMIDLDADLATGSSPSNAKQEMVEKTKREYEEMSERLCDDALKYEHVYREELAQRVSAHFMAEQHLLRGVNSAMKDFMPYTRGLTLDWEELRNTRRANLAAVRRGGLDGDDDDAGLAEQMSSSLPGPSDDSAGKRDGMRAGSSSSNPFGNIAHDVSNSASSAASALASAGKQTSKNIANIVQQYAAKPAAKKATGLDNVKL